MLAPGHLAGEELDRCVVFCGWMPPFQENPISDTPRLPSLTEAVSKGTALVLHSLHPLFVEGSPRLKGITEVRSDAPTTGGGSPFRAPVMQPALWVSLVFLKLTFAHPWSSFPCLLPTIGFKPLIAHSVFSLRCPTGKLLGFPPSPLSPPSIFPIPADAPVSTHLLCPGTG